MSVMPEPVDEAQRKLARNEQIKLSASALNTLATAMATLGVLGPLAGFIYAPASFTPGRPVWVLLLSAAAWAIAGAGLHYAARNLLRKLAP